MCNQQFGSNKTYLYDNLIKSLKIIFPIKLKLFYLDFYIKQQITYKFFLKKEFCFLNIHSNIKKHWPYYILPTLNFHFTSKLIKLYILWVHISFLFSSKHTLVKNNVVICLIQYVHKKRVKDEQGAAEIPHTNLTVICVVQANLGNP